MKALFAAVLLISATAAAAAGERALIDSHIHYSNDAWDVVSPAQAIAVLRRAGIKKAFVSSSGDDGTQRLFKQAPDLIVPVLRPYRKRGTLGTWKHDQTVIPYLEDRLKRFKYAGIGEFHADGADIDLPVIRRLIQMAKQHGLFLHAHSDADAVARIFAQNPEARVLWAHAGFAPRAEVRRMMARYPNLRADLAFRFEHAEGVEVNKAWRRLFMDFPNRFLLGTDTYTPGRWSEVVSQADWSRQWLKDLPEDLASKIAAENAEALLRWARGE